MVGVVDYYSAYLPALSSGFTPGGSGFLGGQTQQVFDRVGWLVD